MLQTQFCDSEGTMDIYIYILYIYVYIYICVCVWSGKGVYMFSAIPVDSMHLHSLFQVLFASFYIFHGQNVHSLNIIKWHKSHRLEVYNVYEYWECNSVS